MQNPAPANITNNALQPSSPHLPPVTIITIILGSLLLSSYATSLFHAISAYFRPDAAFFSATLSVTGLAVGAAVAGLGKKNTARGGTTLAALGLTCVPASFLPSLLTFGDWPSLVALSLVQALPLVIWGRYLATVIRDHAPRVGTMVAAATSGSAMGIPLSFLAMTWAGGPVAVLWMSSGGFLVAALCLSRSKAVLTIAGLTVLTLAAGGLATSWNLTPVPIWSNPETLLGNPLTNMLQNPRSKVELKASNWEAGTRMDLLGLRQGDEDIRWLFRNGALHSIMPGQPQQRDVVAWLREPFPLPLLPLLARHPNSLLCIDPGGGLEMRIASDLGVKNMLAMEPDRAMQAIWQQTINLHGGLLERPGIRFLYGDVRRLLEEDAGQHDMVLLNLRPNTTLLGTGWATPQDFLSTTEALAAYWNHLAPGGILVLTAINELHFAKALGQTVELLANNYGQSPLALHERLWGFQAISPVANNNGYNFLLIAMKGKPDDLFTENLSEALRNLAVRQLFGPTTGAALPYSLALDSATPQIGRNRLAMAFSQHYQAPIDLTSTTDQRPFFFQHINSVEPFIKGTLGVTVGLGLLFFVFPLPDLRHLDAPKAATCLPLPVFLIFFVALGTGGLFAEEFLVHWAVISVAAPSFSFPLTLGLLLAGLATGAGFAGRLWHAGPTKILVMSLAVATILLLTLVWSSRLPDAFLPQSGPAAMAVAILAAFFVGACMGPALPHGIQHLNRDIPGLIPWALASLCLSLTLGSAALQWLARFHGFDTVGIWAAGCLVATGALGVLLWRADPNKC